MNQHDVLEFWFDELRPEQWWLKDSALDAAIASRFSALWTAACRCECAAWRHTPAGRLAEVIVLDQFSRNIQRDQPAAFSQDALALALAQEAVACGADQALAPRERSFLYLPYMHSESLFIHQQAEQLFNQEGMEHSFAFELRHKAIIERFGRYPHRNNLLGRASTAEELLFLAEPGSSF